jgi:hypothetical protein
MKYLKLAVLFLFTCFLTASAQFKVPINNSIRSDFQKLMNEYPQNFEGIRGAVINQNPQTVEYISELKLGNAEECMITKYSSGEKPIYTWQAVMFRSEDFETASKKYKWLFNQLKGANIFYV